MTNVLLGFDQIVALSQQTINSQLSYIWSKSMIDFQFDLDVDADNYLHATTGTPVVNVNLSTDGEVNYGKVLLQFPLTGGSAQGVSFGNTIDYPDLTGYMFQVGVDLGSANPLDSNSGLAVSDAVQTQLDNINQNIYSIASIILDIDSIQYTDTDCVVYDNTGTEVPQLEGMLSSFITSVKSAAGGNPFLLVFNRNLLPNASPSAGLPAFYPTSASYRTEFVDNTYADNDLNSVNLMIMTQDNTAPTLSSSDTYPANLGPSNSDTDGVMHMIADQFNDAFIYDVVLKTISDSMQRALISVVDEVTTHANVPSFQDKNYFTATSDGWSFSWSYSDGTPGDKDTYGDSPVIGQDSGISDIHQITQVYCNCKVSAPKSSSDGISIQLDVTSGTLKIYGDWYERIAAWVHDGQILVGKDFSTSISIEPGASGSSTPGALFCKMADISITNGTVTNENGTSYSSPHEYENPVGTVLDWISGLFGASTFGDIADDFEEDANSAINSFFSDVESAANSALGTLSSNVIMPTGDAYLFTTAQVDSEGNPQFAFTINSF